LNALHGSVKLQPLWKLSEANPKLCVSPERFKRSRHVRVFEISHERQNTQILLQSRISREKITQTPNRKKKNHRINL